LATRESSRKKTRAKMVKWPESIPDRRLGGGNYQEVTIAHQLAEPVLGPWGESPPAALPLSRVGLDRPGAIAADCEELRQWLEVGAMVLVVAPGPVSHGPRARALLGRAVVVTEEDRGL
jgi:hypothetical protein